MIDEKRVGLVGYLRPFDQVFGLAPMALIWEREDSPKCLFGRVASVPWDGHLFQELRQNGRDFHDPS